MSSVLALLVAEVAGVAVPDAATARECPATGGQEIVVCHEPADANRYRLRRQLPDAPAALLPRAEWGLGGGVRMGVEASSAAMPQGAVANRAMARFKIPF